MISLDVYERLKGEVNQLLTKGDNLLEDDVLLLDLLSQYKNPRGVLGLAKELKEEGNVFYKERKFDEALERYGYAGVVLARQEVIENDDDRVEFFELVICILLNVTACLNKKNEFVQVGQICSIILEFDNKNVKAMFRRALAAKELGRGDLAYWDLIMAAEVDPKNKEILAKLEEVKKTQYKDNHSFSSYDEIPTGLGVGLSPPKKIRDNRGLKNMLVQDEGRDKEPLSPKKKEGECDPIDAKQESTGGTLISENKKLHGCPNVIKDNALKVNERGAKEKMDEGFVSASNNKNHILAEPKCRFSNRRRPGSYLSISRNDYQALKKGKTIQCFNSKLGSPMSIRMVTIPKENIEKKDSSHEEISREPTITSKRVVRDDDHVEDIPMDECTIYENESETKRSAKGNEHDYNLNNLWNKSGDSWFWFTSHAKKHSKTELELRVKKRVMQWKTKIATMKDNVKAYSTNSVVVCRYQVGMKRKSFVSHFDSYHRPRKKSLFESCSSVVELCSTHSSIVSRVSCTNNFPFVSCTKVPRSIVEDAHNLARQARNV